MAVSSLVIVHHNTLHWRTNYLSLANTYRKIDPDVILINSHGNQNDNKIRIFNYNIIQCNSTGERSDGSAICIRRSIPYKIIDGLSPLPLYNGAVTQFPDPIYNKPTYTHIFVSCKLTLSILEFYHSHFYFNLPYGLFPKIITTFSVIKATLIYYSQLFCIHIIQILRILLYAFCLPFSLTALFHIHLLLL